MPMFCFAISILAIHCLLPLVKLHIYLFAMLAEILSGCTTRSLQQSTSQHYESAVVAYPVQRA